MKDTAPKPGEVGYLTWRKEHERPAERAMRVTARKTKEQPAHFSPAEIRQRLTDHGWRQQEMGSEMVSRMAGLAEASWWNRGAELLILVEMDRHSKMESAMLLVPARTPGKAMRAIMQPRGTGGRR